METEFSLEGITIAVKRYRQLHLLAAELMFDVFSKAHQLEELTPDEVKVLARLVSLRLLRGKQECLTVLENLKKDSSLFEEQEVLVQ